MNTVTSTNDVVDDVYPLFDLNEDEMSALVALYTLEKTEGTAAYAVDEQIGVWLSDLKFDLNQQLHNDLGIYTIEWQVLEQLKAKRFVTHERLPNTKVDWLKDGVCLYRLCPSAKQMVGAWLTVCQVEMPLLVHFNI